MAAISQTRLAAIRAAQAARIKSILQLPEATGRAALAHHLAFETDFGVDQARILLRKAPVGNDPTRPIDVGTGAASWASVADEINHEAAFQDPRFRAPQPTSVCPNAAALPCAAGEGHETQQTRTDAWSDVVDECNEEIGARNPLFKVSGDRS